MKECDLIVTGKYILPIDSEMTVIKDGAVAIIGNKIMAVGQEKVIKDEFSSKDILASGFSIVLPGLINTHTHAAMTYFRGLADDLPLTIWLNKYIWPAEAKNVNPDFVLSATKLACLEMIKAGVTGFADMYFFEDQVALAATQAGLRVLIGEGLLNFATPSFSNFHEAIRKTLEYFKNYENNELVKISLCPHAIYTCNQEILLAVKEYSERYNLPIHIHIAETKKEVEDCQHERRKSPVQYLNDLGFLSDKVIAAHSVWLDEADLEIYKKQGVKVAHCPKSNMKLASGIAPLPKFLEKDITVGLGTDGAASNNTLDLFSEMRTCALIHKVNNFNPVLVSTKEVVRMATINGAKILFPDIAIGSIEVGKQADLITIDLDKPHLLPIYDPYSHLVYAAQASDVENVIVNGKIIMENQQVLTLDEERILYQAKEFILNR